MTRISSRTIEANGLKFAVDEAGEGNRIALFLHGFPESRCCWRHQLPAIAELGWRAVAPDMRGYGQSSRPKLRSAYRMEHLVADVGALFDAFDAKQRLLIGHDWGGITAWAAAIGRVRPLDALVIINAPHPAVYSNVIRSSWRQRLRSLYVLLFGVPWLPEKIMTAGNARMVEALLERTSSNPAIFPPDVMDQYRRNASQKGAMTAMLNYYRANFNIADTAGGRRVDAPTLLLWGDRDAALGNELVEGTRAFVQQLSIRIMHGISHWVPEEAPHAVNAAIGEWLAQIS